MPQIRLRYPHFGGSAEPRPMKAAEIWAIAADVRAQMFRQADRARVEPDRLINRSQSLEINGIAMITSWELGYPVTDQAGVPVMGEAAVNPDEPNIVMVSINRDLAGCDDCLLRSSMAHELGHVVFDGPRWVRASRQRHFTGIDHPNRRYLAQSDGDNDPASTRILPPGRDWGEWRANEFMGGFLTPPRLLHKELVKLCGLYQVPMIDGAADLPVVNYRKSDPDQIELLIQELAQRFGLSGDFICTRLSKYRLLHGAR